MQGIFPVFLKIFTCNHSYKLVDTKYIKWCLIWIDVSFFQIFKKFEKKRNPTTTWVPIEGRVQLTF